MAESEQEGLRDTSEVCPFRTIRASSLYPWVRSEPLFLAHRSLIDFQSALPHWPRARLILISFCCIQYARDIKLVCTVFSQFMTPWRSCLLDTIETIQVLQQRCRPCQDSLICLSTRNIVSLFRLSVCSAHTRRKKRTLQEPVSHHLSWSSLQS